MKTRSVNIPELDDFGGTLGELGSSVARLVEQYGVDAVIIFDADANNVSVRLEVPIEEPTTACLGRLLDIVRASTKGRKGKELAFQTRSAIAEAERLLGRKS